MGLYRWVWLKPIYYVPKQPVPSRNHGLMFPWRLSASLTSPKPLSTNPAGVATDEDSYQADPPDVRSSHHNDSLRGDENQNAAVQREFDSDTPRTADDIIHPPQDIDVNSSDGGDSVLESFLLALPYVMIFLGVLSVILVSFCIHRKRFKSRMSHRHHLRSLHVDRTPRDLPSRRNAIGVPLSRTRMQMLVPFRLDVGQLMVEIERQHFFRYNSSSVDSCELGIMPPGYFSTLHRRSSFCLPWETFNNHTDKRRPHKESNGTKSLNKHQTQRRGARVQFSKKTKMKRKPRFKNIEEPEFNILQSSSVKASANDKLDATTTSNTAKTVFTVFNILKKR